MSAKKLFQEVAAVALARGWRRWSNTMVVVKLNINDYEDEAGRHYNYEGLCLTYAGECVRLEIHDQDHHLSIISWNVNHFHRTFDMVTTGDQLTTQFDSIEKLKENVLDKIKCNW